MTDQLVLSADYESARQIGPWLAATLEQLRAPQLDRIGELELALHELAINIVDHAYDSASRAVSTYSIGLERQGDDLHAHFCDQGRTFADSRPAAKPTSDAPTVGGYGLIIVEQLARSVKYERVDAENRWTLVFGP